MLANKKKLNISVVIIGRNSESSLKSIYKKNNSLLNMCNEVLYIDSNSTDNSIGIAKNLGCLTWHIISAKRYSPALGRYIGTLESTSDYILFLDSDMELKSVKHLSTILGLFEKNFYQNSIIGVTGDTIDLYPNGYSKKRSRGKHNGESTNHFGGFLLVKRDKLLQVGNWNYKVFANEELELHARIKKNGFHIIYDKELCVNHHTRVPSLFRSFISTYIPLNKRALGFYGSYGFAIKEAFQSGSIKQLLLISPEPIITLLTITFSLIFFMFNMFIPLLFLIISFFIFISMTRSILFIAICPALVIHLLIGLFISNDMNFRYKKV